MAVLPVPRPGDIRVHLSEVPLRTGDAAGFVTVPSCGAVVTFSGVVRESSSAVAGVSALTYEVYEDYALERLTRVAELALEAWPDLGRISIAHRVGEVPLSEPCVVVAVSSPHRAEAFQAAQFCMDVLKASVPVWKLETHAAGSTWSVDGLDLVEVDVAAARWLRRGAVA